MEITKELFFAQYIVAEPAQLTGNSYGILNYATYGDCVKYGFDKRFLQLRLIKELTNSELINIGSVFGINGITIERNEECIFISTDAYFIGIYYTGVVTMYKGSGLNITPVWNYIQLIYDFLRSLSILLPFNYLAKTGHPVQLSIDDLIKNGWVKTK